jgi:hypothetical protein
VSPLRRPGRPGWPVVVPLLLALAPAVSACGGDDDPGADVGERPDLPTAPPELWNPCDGLDPDSVSEAFGTTFTARTGTDEQPQCSFAPTAEGDTAVDVNYQLFAGTLDDLLETFGDLEVADRTEVSSPEVAEADDARVILDVNEGTLAVTGFVRNGQLVQVVNALDPEPFTRDRVVRAVTTLLTDLSAHASESGLSDESDGSGDNPGASPSDSSAPAG